MSSRGFLLGMSLLVITLHSVSSQEARPAYFDRQGEVILPQRYNRSRRYPLFVVLPPTGARAEQVAHLYGVDPHRQETFILMLPEGRPTRDEYLPDFMTFVGWYEERLFRDIDHVLSEYAVDEERLYVGGYSLGGDLSWALSVRNPELFAGAVIAGSRTSHPVEDDALRTLRNRGFRAAFLIGNREDPLRYRGINVARQRFQEAGIAHMYEEYSGAHDIPSVPLLQEAIRYVTETESLPAPGAPARVAAAPGGSLFSHESGDRFAVGGTLPADIGTGGLSLPDDTEATLRIEFPWEHWYVRSTAAYATTMTTTGVRNRRLTQDVVGAWGDGRHFYGVGGGWDWLRDSSDGALLRRYDLVLMHGMRNPPYIPAGRDPRRIDSLFLLRYTIPAVWGAEATWEELLNVRGEYLLRVADRFVVDLAAGTSTIQNGAVDAGQGVADAFDHRWEWDGGFAVRAPSPFLWRLGYQGVAFRPVDGDEYDLRGTVTLSLEFSF